MADLSSLESRLVNITKQISDGFESIGGQDLTKELENITSEMKQPDFWSDAKSAGATSKRHAKLEARTSPWQKLLKDSADLNELIQIADESMVGDIEKGLVDIEASFSSLKDQLKLSGPYDDHDAIVSVHAGAGGTDAQDWAEMLERMYLRWAEKHNLKTNTIDRSAGDEAGLKSTSFELSGAFAYGTLKGEHGVHRLVRLSPYNSDNLRQTSFAKVEVVPKIDSPAEVEIDEKDLKIDVYRSGGRGGQSVNTTDSAVRITHLPTGINVAIQNERSQLQNKETAMTILRSKLVQLQLEQHAAGLAELKGPNEQAAWGNQIRSYVLHPYKMVKDLRTLKETSDTDAVLDGDIDIFIEAYLDHNMGGDK